MTREKLEAIVRHEVLAALAVLTKSEDSTPQVHDLVNVDVVRQAGDRGQAIVVKVGGIVTPLAREEAEQRGVKLVQAATEAKSSRATHSAPSSATPPSVATKAAVNPRRIAIASDHGGFALKHDLVGHLRGQGYDVLDLGAHDEQSVDYPDLAHALARAVADGTAGRGVVVDGAGIGSSIVANKVPGVRAALCHNLYEARNSREHNDANVLALGGRVIGIELARAILDTWLSTTFAGGRHARRVEKIRAVESGYLRG